MRWQIPAGDLRDVFAGATVQQGLCKPSPRARERGGVHCLSLEGTCSETDLQVDDVASLDRELHKNMLQIKDAK